MTDVAPALGIDVGGTKVAGVALDPAEPTRQLAAARADTPRGSAAIVDAIATVVGELDAQLAAAGQAPARTVGIGAPGLVDLDGVLRLGPNLPGVVELDLAGQLAGRVRQAVHVDNDANCAAWAEARLGAAVGVDQVVLVTLGTGIGGAVITGGRLLRGAHGYAGEPGHMLIDPAGPPCPCGRRGCWERFASGSGLGRLARQAAEAGRADRVVELAGGSADDVRGEHVTRAALDGDTDALVVFEEFGWWVAIGIANLVNLLDPELVVIAGGLAEAGRLVLEPVRTAFHHLVLGPVDRSGVRIELARLGPDAGAVGAALLGHERA